MSRFREAVYHGVRAGSMPADEILGYADRAVRYGGKQAADGMAIDLQEYLEGGAHPELFCHLSVPGGGGCVPGGGG